MNKIEGKFEDKVDKLSNDVCMMMKEFECLESKKRESFLAFRPQNFKTLGSQGDLGEDYYGEGNFENEKQETQEEMGKNQENWEKSKKCMGKKGLDWDITEKIQKKTAKIMDVKGDGRISRREIRISEKHEKILSNVIGKMNLHKKKLEFERLSMKNEDFRSFESRRIENENEISIEKFWDISKVLENICEKLKKNCGIILPSNHIDNFVLGLQFAIEKHLNCTYIELYQFIVHLCEVINIQKLGFHKIQIGDTFFGINLKPPPKILGKNWNITEKYNEIIEKIEKNQELPDEIKEICKGGKKFLVSIDLERIKNTETDELKEELQCKIGEFEILKSKVFHQIDSLTNFSKKLRLKDVDLTKIEEKLKIEEENFLKKGKNLEEKETALKNLIKSIKKDSDTQNEKEFQDKNCEKQEKTVEKVPDPLIDTEFDLKICEIIVKNTEEKEKITEERPKKLNLNLKDLDPMLQNANSCRVSPIISNFRSFTPSSINSSFESPQDLISLQNELKVLENLPISNEIELKIVRIKTQISAIRSTNAMRNSFRNNSGQIRYDLLKNSPNSFNFSPILRSFSPNIQNFENLNNQNHVFKNVPLPSKSFLQKNHSFGLEKLNEIQNLSEKVDIFPNSESIIIIETDSKDLQQKINAKKGGKPKIIIKKHQDYENKENAPKTESLTSRKSIPST